MDNKQGVDEQLRELALFAGAGGGILGGKLLGWRTVCAVEIEPYPASVLCARQNDGILETFPIWDDVSTFDGKPWRGRVDVVSGGFPCQDISAAGKGAGIENGERSGLWREFARIIREVRPRYVFVENSPMLVSRGLGIVLGDLAAMGYAAEWGVLGACDVGAPHKRERIWICAKRNKLLSHAEHDRIGRREQQPQGIGEAEADVAYTGMYGLSPAEEQGSTSSGGDSSKAEQEQTGQSSGLCTARIYEDVADTAGAQDNGIGGDCECERNAMGREEQTTQRNNGEANYNSSGGCGTDVADTPVLHAQGCELRPGQVESGRSDCWNGGRDGREATWWAVEPDVGRVAHGVAARVDRLKAIGNGQVPAVAATAFMILNTAAQMPAVKTE